MTIQDFRLDAVHTFQVRTLKKLGFETRVGLNNMSHLKPEFATDYRVDLSVYGPTGQFEGKKEGIARVECGRTCLIDGKAVAPDAEGILVFHLMPERLLPLAKNGKVNIGRDELYHLFVAQGQYVEYYRGDGFASGVLYQSGAFNYDKFSKERSTILQAPKVFVSKDIKTYLSLTHTSFTEGYDTVARVKCALVDAQGNVAARWVEEIRPFEAALIDFRDKVGVKGSDIEFYGFYGVCENASLISLTFHHNPAAATLAVEHSLPPMYYAANLTGPMRARTLSAFARSPIFAGLEAGTA